MNEVTTRLINLPTTVRAFTTRDTEGDFNIYLNARMNDIQRMEAYQHEMKHITNDDFYKNGSIDAIEAHLHRK